jgi:predicted O-methyltransferase YrrM
MGMDESLRLLLEELHADGIEFDADRPDRQQRRRNLEPATAHLLSVMVRATRTRQLLELGTSNGYSTLWLADAVRATGGRVTSVDNDGGRSAQAAANLKRAGLSPWAELWVQDAAEALRESGDEQWDMIFLDAERSEYPAYWDDLQRTLRPGGVLAVDNVLSHPDEVAPFRELVDATGSLTQATIPGGAGLLLVVLDRP